MQLVLDIIEKAPQLAGLKNVEKPKTQSLAGKRLPGTTAAQKKAAKNFLNESGLTEAEIREITA